MRTLLAAARPYRVPLGTAVLLAFVLTCKDVTVTPVAVRNVAVTPTDTTLMVGEELTLTAIVTDEAGNRLNDRAVTWSSEDDAVVFVSSTGDVVAVSDGETSVTAVVEGRSGAAAIHVLNPQDAEVESVEVDPTETSIAVGATVPLEAIATSASGTVLEGRDVAWSSSDEDVATVDREGVVTGASAGEARITATVEGAEGTALVRVTEVVEPVARVEVEPADTSVYVGETAELTAIARSENGDALGGRDVSWSSGNPGVATVDEDGLVTALSPGTSTITAIIEGFPGTAVVTVSLAPVDRVDITPPEATVVVDGTVQLEAIPLSAAGDPLEGRAVSWQSSAESVATVSAEGLVTGVAEGEVMITATVEEVTDTADITVSLVPVDSVSVEPTDTSIFVGEMAQLNAIAFDAAGETLEGRVASWESSDSAFATIDAEGVVTGLSPGEATITATVDTFTATAKITVSLVPVASVKVEPAEASVFVGQTVPLEATPLNEDGEPLDGRGPASWTSSDDGVATVGDDGVVTGVAPGNAMITATIEDGGGTANVTVSLVPVESIVVTPDSIDLGLLGQQTFTAQVFGDGIPSPGRLITWSTTSDPGFEPCPGISGSGNAGVTLNPQNGTSDANGRATTEATTALSLAGTVIIYATAEGKVGCAKIVVSIL